jgi:hypothetical protein
MVLAAQTDVLAAAFGRAWYSLDTMIAILFPQPVLEAIITRLRVYDIQRLAVRDSEGLVTVTSKPRCLHAVYVLAEKESGS